MLIEKRTYNLETDTWSSWEAISLGQFQEDLVVIHRKSCLVRPAVDFGMALSLSIMRILLERRFETKDTEGQPITEYRMI